MMNGKHIGRSVRRLEDSRFLVGRGRYVADIGAPASLYGHVLRSPHAHALIERIDVSRGASLAGVQGIYTAADLAADGLGPLPCMAAVKPLIVPPRPALAVGRVRHVGDPVAFIVADSEESLAAMRLTLGIDADHGEFLRRFRHDDMLGPSTQA